MSASRKPPHQPAHEAREELEMASEGEKILFACVHNAGRSQMAAAWLNHLAPLFSRPRGGTLVGISAGTAPGSRVHPEVVAAMQEVGIDLSAGKPQYLSDDLAKSASLLVTMGCGEACPAVPGLRREDWPLEDPKGKPITRVREIRDEIRGRVSDLLERWGASSTRQATVLPTLIVQPATATDLQAVASLLVDAGLTTAGLEDQFPRAYALVWQSNRIGAVAGLELYGDVGLLRSVAIRPELRSRGLGRQLVYERLQCAALQGAKQVYLLTTTAASFFKALGFVEILREQVPAGLRASPEFSYACPSSATCLVHALGSTATP